MSIKKLIEQNISYITILYIIIIIYTIGDEEINKKNEINIIYPKDTFI